MYTKMSNIDFFILILLSTKFRSMNSKSVNEYFPSKLSPINLREIQTHGFDIFDLRNNSPNSFSEERFPQNNVSSLNKMLIPTKFNSLNLENSTILLNNSFGICEQKLLKNFKGNAKSTVGLPWYFDVFRGVYYIIKRCKSKVECYRKRILRGMDRMIETKSVRLADGIFLVKDEEEEEESTMPRDSKSEPFMTAVSRKAIRVLETHALRVRLGIMKENVGQARIGHHGYRHAFPMMVSSFILLASFMVPMGFQFLAVVGGKALVLSQIALVMALGSMLQRFYGFGNQKQGNLGGIVQHDYYLRDGIQPWQRQGLEDKNQMIYPHRHQSKHQQELTDHQQQLTHHQLQGLMNYQQ